MLTPHCQVYYRSRTIVSLEVKLFKYSNYFFFFKNVLVIPSIFDLQIDFGISLSISIGKIAEF